VIFDGLQRFLVLGSMPDCRLLFHHLSFVRMVGYSEVIRLSSLHLSGSGIGVECEELGWIAEQRTLTSPDECNPSKVAEGLSTLRQATPTFHANHSTPRR
jgi:hypothetical protein